MKDNINEHTRRIKTFIEKPENKWILCWVKTVLYDCDDPADVDFMTDQLYMEEFGYTK